MAKKTTPATTGPVCMAEEYWANSQFSIARHYGGIRYNGNEYIIVNDRGMDLWECTHEANQLGREKAIPAGEPADLLLKTFQPYYRKLGRARFLEILKDNNTKSHTELHEIYKEACK